MRVMLGKLVQERSRSVGFSPHRCKGSVGLCWLSQKHGEDSPVDDGRRPERACAFLW